MTDKLYKVENNLKAEIESNKLNSKVSTSVIKGIENLFQSVNTNSVSDEYIDSLVTSHLDLDLIVKKNDSEIKKKYA